MENSTETNPLFNYNEGDHSALVMVATTASSVVMVFTIIAKGFLQRTTRESWQGYNSIIYIGAFLMTAQTICIATATRMGIGKHLATVHVGKDNILKVRLLL